MTPEGLEPQLLLELANTRMPFGRYQGRLLLDVPEPYLVWMSRQGFPRGRLGVLLENALVVKTNGLEALVRPLRRDEAGPR
jgi:uncharacterized protein (DUF3820 family)